MGPVEEVILCLMVGIYLGGNPAARELSTGDQLKVHVSLTEAKTRLEIANDILNMPSSASTISVVAQAMRVYSNLIGAFSTFTTLLFRVAVPSQQDILTSEFTKAHKKLEATFNKNVLFHDELKSSVEFNAWHTVYSRFDFAIGNGDQKLQEVIQEMLETTDSEKRKLAEEYIEYYDDNRIDGTLRDIYGITGDGEDAATRNFIDVFINERGCKEDALGNLTMIFINLVVSGINQEATYLLFKGRGDAIRSSIERAETRLHNIYERYSYNLWCCRRDIVLNAKKLVKKIMDGNEDATPEQLSVAIRNQLSEMSNLYSWEVVFYEEFPNVGLTLAIESRGQTYFNIKDRGTGNNKRSVLIVWQDAKVTLVSCDISDAETLVFFRLCDGCNANASATSGDMMSRKTCPNEMEGIIDKMLSFERESVSEVSLRIRERVVDDYDFIAAQPNAPFNPCHRGDDCRGHGRCKHIPFTRDRMCICDERYLGENCQEYVNTTLTDRIVDLMGELRQNNWIVLAGSLPATADVYFELLAIPQKLEEMRNSLQGQNRNTICALANRDIPVVRKTARAYANMISNNITEDRFKTLMDRENFETISRDVNQYIRGEPYCRYDFLTLFKRSLFRGKCTEHYNREIANVAMYLMAMDEKISEAWLWYEKAKVRTSGSQAAHAAILQNAIRLKTQSGVRQMSYITQWRTTSCPRLGVRDSYQTCGQYYTFIGMNVTITCENNKQPTVPSVTCQGRYRGSHGYWSHRAACIDNEWGTWRSWSSCSRTCGNGTRVRTRSKTLGERDSQSRSCYTQDCCQSKYGKYKCSSGQCIASSQSCDGRGDCNDGSDEAPCSYLRSGDDIALRVKCYDWDSSSYLGCWVGSSWGLPRRPSTGCNLATSLPRHEEVFTIHRYYGNHRDPIRYGDSVAIKSASTGQWLSCPGDSSMCKLSESRGFSNNGFWIYSVGREGHCSAGTRCVGNPISPGDIVFIKYSTGNWLSADGSILRIRTCPGDYVNSHTLCSCEKWSVFRR